MASAKIIVKMVLLIFALSPSFHPLSPSISTSSPCYILRHGCSATSVLAFFHPYQPWTDFAILSINSELSIIQSSFSSGSCRSDRIKPRAHPPKIIAGGPATKSNLPLSDSLSCFEPLSINEPCSGSQSSRPTGPQQTGKV